MANGTVLNKLLELVGHAALFVLCLIFIAAIAIAIAYLLCWLERRLQKTHHMRQVFRALHMTAFALLVTDCALLLLFCGYAVAHITGLS